MDPDIFCSKKRKYIECSLCEYFCWCHGPPKKKHERGNKKENDVEISTSTRRSKCSCTLVELDHADSSGSDTDETSMDINSNVEIMNFACVHDIIDFST